MRFHASRWGRWSLAIGLVIAFGCSGSDSDSGSSSADDDVLAARSIDDGATWTGHAELNTNAGTDLGRDLGPHVTTDGQEPGAWVATWHSTDSLGGMIGTDADILVARSTDAGATWTAPAALNTNAASDMGDDAWPYVTTDGDGIWVAVWWSTDSLGDTIGTDYDVLVARSTDDGVTWSAPAALNTNAASDIGDDTYQQVTTDGQGAWVASWHSWDSLGGTIGGDYDVLVARSTDDGVTWTAPAALNTNAVGDAGSDSSPRLTTDGQVQGTWVAVWRSTDWLGDTIGTDWDILVAHSTDDGGTWTAPAALNTSAASDAGEDAWPQVTTDGKGTWVAIWSSWDSLGDTVGEDADILVARSTDDGVTWTAPAALNTNAASDAADDIRPRLTTDARGTWVAVWEEDNTP
jgi:lipid-binding SYLF domain-containing protein